MTGGVGFSREWLALREPADRAARDKGLLGSAAGWLRAAPRPLALDLGCGTGATARAFGDAVPGLRWRLLDRDPDLLAVAAARAGPRAEAVEGDLAEVAGLPLAGVRLVTASALLDLASAAWVEALAERLAAAGVGLYAGLSYDGSTAWAPPLAGDAAAVAALNAHQRRDKGLGPALGPEAAAVAAEALRRLGFAVRTAPSPWRLGAGDGALAAAFVAGVAAAAGEAGMAGAADWAHARLAAGGRCTVGHLDLLALPPL